MERESQAALFRRGNEHFQGNRTPVLLLMPPLYQTGREPDYNPKEPMSLMVLAAQLRRNKIATEILDADVEALSLSQTTKEVIFRRPQVLGISVFQRSLPSVESLIKELKSSGLKDTHIVLGGITATLSHEAILRRLGRLIDCVVLGEGEDSLVELSQKVLSGQDWKNTSGIAFMHNDEIVVTSPPKKIDPSKYPPPSRDYLGFCSKKTSYATVLSGIGCYGRCTFCSNYTFEAFSGDGPRWRGRNPEEVVEEMAQINRRHGIRVFKFNDPNLFGPGRKGREHVVQICQGIVDRSLDLNLMAFCRGDDILADPDVLPLMKQAGFERLLIGVEASNNQVLDLLQKDETIEKMEKAIDLIQSQGMSVVIGFMIFNPYTTKKTLRQDLAFLRRRGFSPTLSKPLRVFDGTPIQGLLDESGRLIACNPFDGYHEYIVPADIAAIYMSMKHLSVNWLDTLKKHYQSRIWEVKKAPSFHERTDYYSLSDHIFNLEADWMEILLDWVDNGFTQAEIRDVLDQLWKKRFAPVLEALGVDSRDQEVFLPLEVLASQVYGTIKGKPHDTFPEKYRWQND